MAIHAKQTGVYSGGCLDHDHGQCCPSPTRLLQKGRSGGEAAQAIGSEEVISGERIFVVVSTTSRDPARLKCLTLRHGVPLPRRCAASGTRPPRAGARKSPPSACTGARPRSSSSTASALARSPRRTRRKRRRHAGVYRAAEPETFEAASALFGADHAALYEFVDTGRCPGKGVFAFIAGLLPRGLAAALGAGGSRK